MDSKLLSVNATMQIKGLAIIFVILGHLHIVENAGAWGVAMFLVVSGFGLTQSYNKNGLNCYFTKKINKILLPYSLVTVVWLLINYFILDKNYGYLKILLLVLGLDLKSSIDSTMWYISFILLWYMVFYIAFKLMKNKITRLTFILIYSILFYMFVSKAFSPYVASEHYVFEFPIGVVLGMYCTSINKLINKCSNLFLAVVDIGCLIIFVKFMGQYSNIFLNVICMNLIVIVCIITFILFDKYRKKSKVLTLIGSLSYEIYLFEGVFLWRYKFIFNAFDKKYVQTIVYISFIIILSVFLKILVNVINKLLEKKTVNRQIIKEVIS